MPFLATINTPGYLPWDDYPPVFETAAEAWDYLADWRREMEDDLYAAAHTAALSDVSEPYSATVNMLESLSRGNFDPAFGVAEDGTGTLWGPTGGDHDLGHHYTVTEVPEEEPLDVWLRIPDGQEEADAEANVSRHWEGHYLVKWDLTAVGLVTTIEFETYEAARAWLTSEGFQDFSS